MHHGFTMQGLGDGGLLNYETYVHTARCLVMSSVVNVIGNGSLMWHTHGYSLMAFEQPYIHISPEKILFIK